MITNLLLSMFAGGLTILSPCVLPVAPLVMGASVHSSRFGPLALLGGMILSFAAIGTFISALFIYMGLSTDLVATIGASLLIAVGLIISFESLSGLFKKLAGGFSQRLDTRVQSLSVSGTRAQFLIGLTIGLIWAPCTGPTLGAAISLAIQGKNLFHSFLTMLAFGVGAAIPLLILGFGARRLLKHRQAISLSGLWLSRSLGGIFIVVGIVTLFNWHKLIESAILDVLPDWWVQMISSV